MIKILFEDRETVEEIASEKDLKCYHYGSTDKCNNCIINHFILDTNKGGKCVEIAKELLNLIDNQK